MSVISNNSLAGSSGQGGAAGYAIERSLRFNPGDSAHLSKTFASAGNRKTWTWSGWVKKTNIGSVGLIFAARTSGSFNPYSYFYWNTDDSFTFIDQDSSGGRQLTFKSTKLFRDPSAWYHLVVVWDTTNTTQADRFKFYVNGIRHQDNQLSWVYPDLDDLSGLNSTSVHGIGREGDYSNTSYLDGSLADIHFIDGQALAASDFGEFDDSNVWQPKKFAGTYSGTFTYDAAISVSATRAGNAYGTAQAIYTDPAPAAIYGDYVSSGASIEIEWATAIAGVTSITFNGGPNGASATFQLFINDVAVTTASEGYGAKSYTISSTNITKFKIVGSDGYGLANLKFNGSTPTGTIGINGTAYGANSFHLDFSDTSSNAALGTDSSGNSNSWTVNNLSVGAAAVDYSAMMTNVNAGAIGNAFSDSTPNTGAVVGSWGTGSGTTTFTPTGGIAVSSSLVVYYGAYDNTARIATLTITYNDTTTETDTFTSGQNNWMGSFTASNAAGKTIQSISVAATGGYQMFGGFVVDGTALLNSAAVITDALRDSPVNGDPTNDTGAGGEISGNYATLNPLHHLSTATLANGNLQVTSDGKAFSSLVVKSGKWYVEYEVGSVGYNLIFSQLDHPDGASPSSTNSKSIGWYGPNGYVYWGAGSSASLGGTTMTGIDGSGYMQTYAIGDTLGAAIDMDNSIIKYYRNGTEVGSIDFSTGTAHRFAEGMYISTFGGVGTFNFGQRAFAYTAPSGYKCLNTANLPDPTIADGSTAFDTKLFTGNASTQSITGLNFSPDLVWTKSRSTTYSHRLYDAVRGANNWLSSNGTDANTSEANTLTSFDANGFSVGASENSNQTSGGSAVAWAWDAGSSNTTIAAGGLNSSVYYMSEVWSDDLYTANGPSDAATVTTQSFLSGYPATNPFNGNGNGAHETYAADSLKTIVFRPDTALTGVTKLEYYTNGAYASDVGYNSATSVITGNTTVGWQTLYEGTAITVNYVWAYKNNGQGSFTGVKVNGRMLVDSGVTPPTNVPSIASTVRANPSAGFSIVSYTGNPAGAKVIAHGLSAKPYLIIVKNRTSGVFDWPVYHNSIGVGSSTSLKLNLPDAATHNYFPTEPTSSVFYTTSSGAVGGGASDDMVAYCFSPVEGYSAMGSYSANGSATDGPFVYTGFRPAFLLIKCSTLSNRWVLIDSSRNSYNGIHSSLYAEDSVIEYTGNLHGIDLLSNGFKIKNNDGIFNTASATYVYMAIASNPFKTSRAR